MVDIHRLIAKRKEKWQTHFNLEEDGEYISKVVDYLKRNKDARVTVTRAMTKNPELMVELFFVIVDKNQKTVPFFLNDVQNEFKDILNVAIAEYERGERNHLKFLLLKGRQQGFTQFITAYQLACCLLRKNFAGFTLADTSENTEVIFTDKAKYPLGNLPEYIKPTQMYNNRRELLFQKSDAKGRNSKMRVSTAGNEDVGRSKTVHFFHGSEVAFWKDLNAILKALGEALTKSCVAVLETTANGYNAYKMLWDDPNSNWQNVFFAWWKTSEYRLDFESDLIKTTFIRNVKEAKENDDAQSSNWCLWRVQWLMEQCLIDWEQAYWYYNKWRDLHEDIKQEYPCSPSEAFMSTGQNYFSVERLVKRQAELESVPILAQGYFEYEYITDELTKDKLIDSDTITWIDSSNGDIKIFIEAEPYTGYIIGGDTATDGSDNNIGQVIDKQGRQMAILKIAKDEDLFADQMFCLGWYYNTALIAPEINHSTHPTKVLVQRQYPNIYVKGTSEKTVEFGDKAQPRYGFRTDVNNRPSMLGLLREMVREHTDNINDLDTIKEMLTFIRNDKGKPVAEVGEHDDRVIAYAIALMVSATQDEELEVPLDELVGYYTESELEDLGYSRYEIAGYMSGRLTLYKEGKQ